MAITRAEGFASARATLLRVRGPRLPAINHTHTQVIHNKAAVRPRLPVSHWLSPRPAAPPSPLRQTSGRSCRTATRSALRDPPPAATACCLQAAQEAGGKAFAPGQGPASLTPSRGAAGEAPNPTRTASNGTRQVTGTTRTAICARTSMMCSWCLESRAFL